MTWLLNLFTTFNGRISRKDWWIGFLILTGVLTAGQWLTDPSAFEPNDDPEARPSPIMIFWNVIAFVPTLAITLKRLNDRDQPQLLGYLFAIVYVACAVLFQFLPDDWVHFGPLEWALTLPLLLFSLWIFIDNGFLKGTKGPNRYGPDPLDPGSVGTSGDALPETGNTRYTGGAFARDAIVGVIALIAAVSVLFPKIAMESTVDFMIRLSLGEDYEDYKRSKLVNRHLELFDPESEQEEAKLDEQMRAHAQAWEEYQKGISASFDKRHADAVRDFTLAIERYGAENKVAADVFLSRARSYAELKRPAKARKDYSIAIALRPDWSRGYSSRGNFNIRQKHYEKALANFEQAIRVSRVPNPYYETRRGYALRKLKRPEQALGAYRNAIKQAGAKYERLMEIDRDMPDLTGEQRKTFEEWAVEKRDRSIRRAESGRGYALSDLKLYDDAVTALTTAIRLDPEVAYPYIERGWAYEKLGHLELAMADYKQAIKLGSASDWLKKAIARVKPKVR